MMIMMIVVMDDHDYDKDGTNDANDNDANVNDDGISFDNF